MTGVGRKNRTRVGQPRAVLLRVDRPLLAVGRHETLQSSTRPRQKKRGGREGKGSDASWGVENSEQTRQARRPRNLEGATVDSWTGDGWGLGGGLLARIWGMLGWGSGLGSLECCKATAHLGRSDWSVVCNPLQGSTEGRSVHPSPSVPASSGDFCGRVPGSCDLWSAFMKTR